MKEEHLNEIKAIVVLAAGMILLASLVSFVPEDLPWYTSHPNFPAHNLIKITGAYLAGSLLFLFGLSSYFIIGFLFFWSWNKFTNRDIKFSVLKLFSLAILLSVFSSFFGLTGPAGNAADRFSRAGFMGAVSSDFLVHYLGRTGSYIILVSLGILSLILTGEFLIRPLVARFMELGQGLSGLFSRGLKANEKAAVKKVTAAAKLAPPKINFNLPKRPVKAEQDDDEDDRYAPGAGDYEDGVYEEDYGGDEGADIRGIKGENAAPKIRIKDGPKPKKAPRPRQLTVGEYKLPSLDLLEDSPDIPTDKLQSDLMFGARLLEETLASFGVSARVADIERGPAITRYELEPAPGVKVQKFTTLSDDIALAMQAQTVRIVAPIPGKSRVGIEVPNAASASVYLKDVLSSEEFQKSESKLTLSLGKDIAGKAMVADLAEMPHLLIAGTTGSGKTVCVNSIIMSMLFNSSPREVRFVMVDPKMVEMSQYNDIPHLLCPTVTDSKKAVNALNWVVAEMDSRYKRLSKAGSRNIKGYNKNASEEDWMPYIVVIIDELADLMQVSGKAVEGSICRLAQLSRAVGIHLILATQRPSVNVITGVIKANFPARISFKVASKIDSRTVLDMNGAESLLGKGDMLFMQPGDAKPTRGQGNFVKDEEIHRVIEFIRQQQDPIYDDSIIQHQAGGSGAGGSENDDPLFDEAVNLVIETNQASVSVIQRRMRLGYTRAARLIDMMEQNGIVGPYVGSKARDILVDREQWMLDHAPADDNSQVKANDE
jgi:S-DNA-T family DNA segregation ATPase FtsK/SpoIIIE